MQISGAELVVKALKEEKTDTLFAYPGGQAIDLFHALYGERNIRVITPRHEQGLVHAADGYARSTGKTGVCLVTSGPGAANLVTGIATANMDSVPLVCFTGQVPRNLIGKDSFQEVDTVSIMKTVCKYAVTVRDRKELGPAIKRAFEAAKNGKPGAAVIDLPKDIQQELGSDLYSASEKLQPAADVCLEQIRRGTELLKTSRRPLFLAGGGVNIAHAGKEMTRLAEKTGIPVVTTIMGKGALPTSHPLYAGNIGIHGSFAANTAVSQCDLLFAVGTRFSDRVTGNTDEFASQASVIHADIEPKIISRNIHADVAIAADAGEVISALSETAEVLETEEWRRQITLWKQQHPLVLKTKYRDKMNARDVIEAINQLFESAVITTDVGQNQLWTAQFLELTDKKQMITSGGLGTMGYGFPAAIGAKLGNPDKDVVSVCGDGGFQMNIQELATAVAYELPVIVCILNNGYLGNVRQWQEMFYDRHYSGTCTRYRQSCPVICSAPRPDCPEYIPDFLRLAESYGAKGIRVQKSEDIRAALSEAKRTKKVPTVIEFMIGPEDNVLPIVPPGSPLNGMIE
ncbi:biosynthetic-type acetolactate synthase large subunit [Anaerostipes sp.]|uniref:biosynthetic-type acetolactate synthase large subunit n=1 Tax=Anaerostipes sp. TaxID=1872530 RepID=UPI0025BBD5D5|nr:biosynthetic-type acetolactate synthase large subunit [Anaerostipes sp.]MBS7008325.1 biosynthetic-type acetolactate synthase large subunit [Anaerostipes sp.]